MMIETILSEFHFLRPHWFFALLPLAAIVWLMAHRRLRSRSWQSVVDPQLLAHLLIGKSVRQSVWPLIGLSLAGVLAITALAGPAWEKLEQPVYRQQSALVVLLDLSRSMDATDTKPSRLQRAALKLRDILDQRKEGDTALVVYAAMPFVVSPLSPDAKSIASQISSFSTDLMPAQGSRPELAIGMAQDLLAQAGVTDGGVLLITDGVEAAVPERLASAVNSLRKAGHRLSVMGVGTREGAPIPDADGGFLKDGKGGIVLPQLDDAALAALASEGGGAYRRLSTNDSDFKALLAPLENALAAKHQAETEGRKSDQWRDEGRWLLLPLLLLAALAFRRGYLVLVFAVLIPMPRPAYAMDWHSLWQNDNQRGQVAMRADDPKAAAQLFKDPAWRAAANYRAGNYQAAVDELQNIQTPNADYNRGNALAKLGQLPEAIKAYEQALKADPKMADAKANLELVKKLLDQQQQQSDKNKSDKKDKESKQSDKSEDSKDGQKDQSDQSQPASDQDKKKDPSKDQDGKGKPDDKSDQNKPGQNSDKKSDQKPEPNKQDSQPAGADQSKPEKPQSSPAASQSQPAKAEDKPAKPADAAQASEGDDKKLSPADLNWLRRIPDDPGGLWRRKFQYQYKQQQQQGSEKQRW